MARFGSIRELHDAYDAKKASPVEVTRDYLAAIRGSGINAFLTVTEQRALVQAKAAEEILSREGKVPRQKFPLLGVPMGIKDALTIDGVRTTAGSRMLENYLPPYTATCVQRLEAAGMIMLGKLNMDEFAMGGSNENSAFGPVLHPTHPDRVPGGSSGGSAAAVGADLCLASLGSDTGGSIRLPASYCGISGMKPTYGRVSRSGLVAFASSLDQVGPMARTIEDCAIVLDAMSGHDPLDGTSAQRGPMRAREAVAEGLELRGLRIGIPEEFFAAGMQPEVESAAREALRWYESQGAKLVPIRLPNSGYAVSVYYVVAVSEASSNLARYDGVRYGFRASGVEGDLTEFYKKARAAFGPEVKRRIILGTFALSAGYAEAYYLRACQVRRLIRRDFDEAFKSVDLIAGPVAPTTAFRLGEKVQDPLQMYLNDLYTIPANLAGLPALSVPCGMDSAGLPIGLQLLAPAFADEKLLAAAHRFERREVR